MSSPAPQPRLSPARRWAALFALMLAGETIYLLPYLRKTFQTSMEAVFELSGSELGQLNAVFGVLALLCYFPGGWLADRLPTRHLLTVSLLATGLGGFFMLGAPSRGGLLALHAYWGVTSILGFWAALIKATREWGGPAAQGRGFGLLDGGRGLVAALLASFATYLFTREGPLPARLASVLWVYTAAPLVAALAVWLTVPDAWGRNTSTPQGEAQGTRRSRVVSLLRRPDAWLLAGVIFAAYWSYVGSFELPAYAEHVHGRSKSFGAVLGTVRDWARPLACVGAGLLADRTRSSLVVSGSFLLLSGVCAGLWLFPSGGALVWLWLQVVAAATCVFALRGVYFAMLEESGIPRELTGTTVGFVSMVGFLPDTFAFLLSGWLRERAPDGEGYRHYFALLALVALLGFVASTLLSRRTRAARAR